ncbi:MAG: hypothetical protein CMH98_03450 [Oceanospirillaceae bacterium]|nr:hypothetical protein [Oceanospirillaceae bacterium]
MSNQPIRITIEIKQDDSGVVTADIDYCSNDETDLRLLQLSGTLTQALGYILPKTINQMMNDISKQEKTYGYHSYTQH